MKNLTDYQHIIAIAIEKLGLDAKKCQANDKTWIINRGSASISLELYQSDNRTYFKVEALIATLPNEQSTKFYKELLLHNHNFNGFSFSLSENEIYLKAARDTVGMDSKEAFVLITKVGNYADKFDDEIKQMLLDGEKALAVEKYAMQHK